MEPVSDIRDLLLDKECIKACVDWVQDCKGPGVALILESPHTGMGITTLIQLACDIAGVERIHVSSNIPKLKTFLRDAAGSPYTVDFKKKVFVIDPLDAVFADSTCAAELCDFLKVKSRLPVICAGHRLRSSTSKLYEMLSSKMYAVKTIVFPAIEESVATSYLVRIASTFGFSTIPPWTGDLRNALAALSLDISNSSKDLKCDGMQAVWRVLFDDTLTIRESIRMHDGDVSMVVAGTHENYPRTGQSIETCAKLAEVYSMADCMEEAMYSTQRWDLNDVYVALLTGGPVAYLDKKVAKKHKNIDLAKFGTIWSRGNNQRTKEKALRSIRNTMVTQGSHAARSLDGIAMIRMAIMQATKDGKLDSVLPLVRELPNDTILGIMRLWKCGYTQAHYSSLKKRRDTV